MPPLLSPQIASTQAGSSQQAAALEALAAALQCREEAEQAVAAAAEEAGSAEAATSNERAQLEEELEALAAQVCGGWGGGLVLEGQGRGDMRAVRHGRVVHRIWRLEKSCGGGWQKTGANSAPSFLPPTGAAGTGWGRRRRRRQRPPCAQWATSKRQQAVSGGCVYGPAALHCCCPCIVAFAVDRFAANRSLPPLLTIDALGG